LIAHLRRTGAETGGVRLDDGTIICCILYADDVLLLAETPEALQRLIDETARYFETEGMTVNPFKSDIVNFSTSRSVNTTPFTIASVGKEVLKEAKYLGVIFEKNFSWRSQRESISLRCRVALGRCRLICTSLGITKLNTLIQIYDMFVSSIFRYSAGAWGPLAGSLDCIDDIFVQFMRRQYRLPISTSKQGILMQFGRRCASCDAFYLGAVHVARGLLYPDSVWGRVLSQCDQNKWKEVICERLTEMGMLQEVFASPALFLEERKKKAVEFNQWCHHNHLVFVNGTSADLMRVGRPYGVIPAIELLPTFQGRKILLWLLSVWRWGLEGADSAPDYCEVCDNLINSHHLLFSCFNTSGVRDKFQRRTGVEFDETALYSCTNADAVLEVFASLGRLVQRNERLQS
jgi:hypothetical protein